MTAGDIVIRATDLTKVFRLGVRLKRVDALRGVSLEVPRGAVFGFLGPNGAGKTTTIKILTGLIHATSGHATVLGETVGASRVGGRVGYLPEQPYFYDYLTGREMLVFYARLFGLSARESRERADRLIERVGLGAASRRAIRKYSKGMMQRLGIAQALINDPELVIFDEPMSGLDPIGRKDVRDLMLELKRAGKTLFFSSHILADIEMICDRIAIVHRGSIVEAGSVADLLRRAGDRVEILARSDDAVSAEGSVAEQLGELWRYEVEPDHVRDTLNQILSAGGEVVSVSPRRATLEDLFVQEVRAHQNEEQAA